MRANGEKKRGPSSKASEASLASSWPAVFLPLWDARRVRTMPNFNELWGVRLWVSRAGHSVLGSAVSDRWCRLRGLRGPERRGGAGQGSRDAALHGVFLAAPIGADGAPGAWSTIENSRWATSSELPGHDVYAQERMGLRTRPRPPPTAPQYRRAASAMPWSVMRTAAEATRRVALCAGGRLAPATRRPVAVERMRGTWGDPDIYAATATPTERRPARSVGQLGRRAASFQPGEQGVTDVVDLDRIAGVFCLGGLIRRVSGWPR